MSAEVRDRFVEYLQRQLIGPWGGDEEELFESPPQRYLMGTLYPKGALLEEEAEGDYVDDTGGTVAGGAEGENASEDPIALANAQMPSSFGLSFVVGGTTDVEVTVRAGAYEKAGHAWRRRPLAPDGETVRLSGSKIGRLAGLPVFGGRATIEAIARPYGDGRLFTIAIVNSARMAKEGRADPGECLYQADLRCRPVGGRIERYPTADRIHTDEEDEELSLLYRDVPTWAIGHGCSATWGGDDGAPLEVGTAFMPSEVVPDVVFDIDPEDGGETFEELRELRFLEGIIDDPAPVLDGLDRYVASYRRWIEGLAERNPGIPPALIPARDRLLRRLHRAADRMAAGVSVLRSHGDVRTAFGLANRAMRMQMRHSEDAYGGRRRPRNEVAWSPPDYDAPRPGPDRDPERWRPFQLAFALLALDSVADEDSADRDTVDLIWFPTGGGKTEAYLLLAAFTILLRRLRLRDAGGGTTVITRYTLRLLTSQQFQRAAAMVCACELLRRERPEALGTRPVTIGIWVGGGTSPNTYAEALKLKESLLAGEPTELSFQLETCPWCGTEIVPEQADDEEGWGVTARSDACLLNCPSAGCPFHLRLPVSVVDDSLYDDPPTILIATVDKFARMPWKEKAGVFLGAGPDPGPSLIIQDELHLISGPLGTVVALYEAAFDLVLSGHGTRPKVVASTATIRRADRQVRSLFGREVILFPPAGLTADRSYFVRFDRSRPGRRYIGVMAQNHTPTTAMVHVSAAMSQAPVELDLKGDDRDRFWTLVAYHNSLRELGKTVTLARDDIPARIKVIADLEDRIRSVDPDAVIELTSNIPAAQIPRYLERLDLPIDSPGCVDFVACTNMISVGVDVGRLGLMLVVGQPKSTSEYIQASSRVGRRWPGLVITLYSAAKPRDRSHYESFRTYHAALYRRVEPTSVTPFSLPARERALHAALVTVARHRLGLGGNDDAARFDAGEPGFVDVIHQLLDRVAVSDPDERDDTERHVKELLSEWEALKAEAVRTGGLRYEASGAANVALLKRFGNRGTGWETLDSMRSVDRETLVKVRGEDR